MAADDQKCHFFNTGKMIPTKFKSGEFPVKGKAGIAQVHTFAVFVDKNRVYNDASSCFGHYSRRPDDEADVVTAHQMLELFCFVCTLASQSDVKRTGRYKGGKIGEYGVFPKYRIRVRTVPSVHDIEEPAGWILWLIYAASDNDTENADLHPNSEDQTSKEKATMAQRNWEKDPIRALYRVLHFNTSHRDPPGEKPFRPATHASKGTVPVKRWIDGAKIDDIVDLMTAYSTNSEVDWTEATSYDLCDVLNPANPYRAASIKVACKLAIRAGGRAEYCVPECYSGAQPFPDQDGPDEKGDEKPLKDRKGTIFLKDLRHTELALGRIDRTYFPGTMQLPTALSQAKKDSMAARFYDPELAEKVTPAYAMRASIRHMEAQVRSRMQNSCPMQTMESVRASMEMSWTAFETDYKDAPEEKRAAAKLSIQRNGCQRMKGVMHEGGNLPNALKAVCKEFQRVIDTSKHRNLCKKLPRQTTNLTFMGEVIAFMLACIEELAGANTLHRECLLITFAEYHIYIVGKFHPNPLFIGDAMTGKSFLISFRKDCSIPGTFTQFDHLSAGVFNAKDNSDIHFMVFRSEELEPSIAGIAQAGDRSGNALTDKASAVRALMTSMEVNFGRLEKKGEYTSFTRDSATVKTNILLSAAMNPPKGGSSDLPVNMRSRWLLQFMEQRPRPGASVQSKIIGLGDTTNAKNSAQFYDRMKRDQAVCAYICLMVYMKILDNIDTRVTDNIFVAMLDEAAKKGLASSVDIRHFEKTRMIVLVVCVMRAIWEYLDSGLPGFKNQTEKFKYDDLLCIGKLLVTSIEDFVLAATLTSDQYEDPVTYEAVEAIKRLYGMADASGKIDTKTRDAHLAEMKQMAKNLEKKQKADETKKKHADAIAEVEALEMPDDDYQLPGAGSGSSSGAKKPAAAAAAQEEQPSISVVFGVGAGGKTTINGKETPQSMARNTAAADAALTYHAFDWTDGKLYATEEQRLDLLVEKVHTQMRTKPSKTHLKSFLRNQTHEQTDDVARPGQFVPVMCWMEAGGSTRLLMARKLLDNNTSNRLHAIVQDLVDTGGMPAIEYITGTPVPLHPYVMKTIKSAAVLERRKADDISRGLRSASLEDGKDEKKEVVKPKPLRLRDHSRVDTGIALMRARGQAFETDDDKQDLTRIIRPKYIDVDGDLEDYATWAFLQNTCTDKHTLRDLGFGPDGRNPFHLLERSKRYLAHERNPGLEILFEYPNSEKKSKAEFMKPKPKKPTKTKGKRKADEAELPDKENIPLEPDDSSYEGLCASTAQASELSLDASKFRAHVDPEYRASEEHRKNEEKTLKRQKMLEKTGVSIFKRTASLLMPAPAPLGPWQPPASEHKRQVSPGSGSGSGSGAGIDWDRVDRGDFDDEDEKHDEEMHSDLEDEVRRMDADRPEAEPLEPDESTMDSFAARGIATVQLGGWTVPLAPRD